MNRAIILSIFFLPALIYSCKKDTVQPSAQPITMDYAVMGSADAVPPANNTTYTIVSYRDGTTTEADNTSNQQPVGKYAYQTDQTQGILTPCDVDGTYPYGFVSRNHASGQRLTAGGFQTAIISPAYPMVSSQSIGSTRICFQRNNEIYASTPFPMTVTGYQVFGISGELEMKDVRAKISFDIYRHAEAEEYGIESVGELRNAGSYGWYHPLLEITDITNESSTTAPTGITSFEECVIAPTGDTGPGLKTHSTDAIFVFATDYGVGNTSALVLAFELEMQGSKYPITIPVMVDMKKSMKYEFSLIVKLKTISVEYTVRPWGTGYNDDDKFQEIGIPPMKILLGEWTIGSPEWLPGGGGGDEIGTKK